MAKQKKSSLALPWALYHVFIPIVLIASVIFRYNLLSGIYLIFLLAFPYAPALTRKTKGKCMRFTIALLVVSAFFVFLQVIFQIILLAKSPYGSLVGDYCSEREKLLRYLGFERLDNMNVGNIFRLLLPDILCFIFAVCTFTMIKKIDDAPPKKPTNQQQQSADVPTATTSAGETSVAVETEEITNQSSQSADEFHLSATRAKNGGLLFFTAMFLALAGIAEPSLVSVIYLLVFVGIAMTWSFHGPLLVTSVVFLRVALSLLTSAHLMVYYLYQIAFFYDKLPPTTLLARLLGLIQIFQTNCDAPYKLQFYSPLQWTAFASPVVIFMLHWLLAIGVRLHFHSDQTKLRPRKRGNRLRRKTNDKTPLVSHEETPHSYGTGDGPSQEMRDLDANGHELKVKQRHGIMSYTATVISSLQHQSFYVAALIIMMAWSVTYHSWLTLVLLVWSCILWLVRNRAWKTLCCSPAFTVYAVLLILLQYVYSLNLTDSELPTNVTTKNGEVLLLKDFGCVKYTYPCLQLGVQILYTCVFWIVLHQFVFIRKNRQSPQGEEITTPWVKSFADFAFDMLCKYWILVVYAFLIAVCMEGYPSGIKLIYAVLLFFNMIIYEFSWVLWKKTLSTFLMILVIYTMIVVLLVYTYQFSDIPDYWKSLTNFTDEQMNDLGLQQYNTSGELFLHVFIPTMFLLVVILEKHYFIDNFAKKFKSRVKVAVAADIGDTGSATNEKTALKKVSPHKKTSINTGSGEEDEEEETSWWKKCKNILACIWKGLLEGWYYLVNIAWRLLEFHTWKWLAVTVLVAGVNNVSVLMASVFIFWILFLPFRVFHTTVYFVTSLYMWIVILACMFYQMNFITDLQDKDTLSQNCSFDFYNTTEVYNGDFLGWLGFAKMNADASFFNHAVGYIMIVAMLALERTVVRRMDWKRFYHTETKFKLTAVYPEVTWKKMDQSIILYLKYLINYWFYKFGLEACYIMAAITIWVRMDIYGCVYAILLTAALFIKTRKGLRVYFVFYAVILSILLLWQFMAALGMPSVWCKDNEYPWTELPSSDMSIRNRLVRWIYLPDYIIPPLGYYLTADVFQLIFVLCQMHVFNCETHTVCLEHAGQNRNLTLQELDNVTPETNEKDNYFDQQSNNLLDQLKVALFKYSFWVTAAIVFIAGTARISLFCMGYFIAFFYIMSTNESLLMGKPSRLIKIWNIVLGYNISVITLKVGLQIASCVYIDILNQRACIFVQLFSLGCSKPNDYYDLTIDTVTGVCDVPDGNTNSGVTWDFICFFFLVFQRRIFSSLYFRHAAEDMKISMKLASRGAQLFQERLVKTVTAIREKDQLGLAKIKESIIKVQEKYRDLVKGIQLRHHMEATRAGGYYMFQDVDYNRFLRMNASSHMEEESEKKEMLKITSAEDEEVGSQKQEAEDATQQVESPHAEEEEDDGPNIIVRLWNLLVSVLTKVVVFVTLSLNKINSDYRNVALHLAAEKDHLRKKNINRLRESRKRKEMHIPVDGVTETSSDDNCPATIKSNEPSSSDNEAENKEGTLPQRVSFIVDDQHPEYIDLKPVEFDANQHLMLRLFYALWYTAISRTQFLCYFLIILNLMLSASLISIVLPLAVYLWATLSVPRPSNRFWMFCIYYTEVIIIIKFLFQFEFFPWNADVVANTHTGDPSWWPRVIGIEQKSNWSALDLASLLAFFFHRSTLKVQGIWDDNSCNDNGQDAIEQGDQEESNSLVPIESTPAVKGSSNEIESMDEDSAEEDDEEEVPTGFKTKIKAVAMVPAMFMKALLRQEFRAVTDVYIYMFLCDVLNFVIIIFGYWAFGKYSTTKDDVVSNIAGNRVPTGFLVMLLLQFSMMMIDRAIYLRKNAVGKLVFQILLVIGIHIWLFCLLPVINQRPFYENGVAQTWYFFKFIYFLLSAYQLRCGYPSRVLGNFLTKAYGTANLFLFKGYRAIPFLVELTAIMDWMFIETTMGIGEWMKLNSLYAEVFELKCWREFEKNYPGPRGQAKGHVVKYLVGGLLVFLLIAIIWFPLLFMNIALTITGITNNPTQMSIKITCGTFEPMFQIVADSDYMTTFTQEQYNDLNNKYASDPVSAQFLSQFSKEQIVSVKINGVSTTVWGISPPQRNDMLQTLSANNTRSVDLLFEWIIGRDPEKTNVATTSGLNRLILGPTDPVRQQLYNVLLDSTATPSANVPQFYPKYIYASAKSSSQAATKLYTNGTSDYVTVDLALMEQSTSSWWQVDEVGDSVSPTFEIVVFSDKVSPASLGFLVSYGIIGLYVSVVLVVGKLVRGIFGSASSQIMFQELPNVDKIDQLCLDIFLVREEGYFELEEDLFAKLLFLYRSPTTMIEWTRQKQD